MQEKILYIYFSKILLLAFTMVFLVLSGCEKDWLQKKMHQIIQQDQEHEQGFHLTTEEIYSGLDMKTGFLDLSRRGLVAVPDLCELLRSEDHEKVRILSLMNNHIRIVDQDLSCLKSLHTINLAYNNIQSIMTLGDLPSLKKLELHKNELSALDLPDLPGLEELNLGYNKLKSVVGLDKFKNLTKLELQHNLIESIVGVENLKKLKELKLEFNKLTDIGFIDKLDNLILITAKGNELKDSLMQKLQALNDSYVVEYLADQVEATGSGVLSTY